MSEIQLDELKACAAFWTHEFLVHPCRIECRSKIQDFDACIVLVAIFWENEEWPGTTASQNLYSTLSIKLNKAKYGNTHSMVQRINKIFANNFTLLIQKCAQKDPNMQFIDDDAEP